MDVQPRQESQDPPEPPDCPPKEHLQNHSQSPGDEEPTSIRRIEKCRQKQLQFQLTCAIENYDLHTVERLLDEGVNVNTVIVYIETPLTRAITLGLRQIAIVLAKNGADANAHHKNEWKRHAMHLGAEQNFLDVIETLVEFGAAVDSRDGGGMTPLHYAAYHGHTDIVEYLISIGAEVDANDEVCRTPFRRAMENKQFAAATVLIQSGARIDSVDSLGWTSLFETVTFNDQTSLLYLLSNGANPNTRDANGRTPLHLGCAPFARQNMMAILSTTFPFYNRKNRIPTPELQRIALMNRCQNTNVVSMNNLLKFGADINICDRNGKNPVSLTEDLQTLAFLVDRGGRIQQELLVENPFLVNPIHTMWLRKLHDLHSTLQFRVRCVIKNSLLRRDDSSDVGQLVRVLDFPEKLKEFLLMDICPPDVSPIRGQWLATSHPRWNEA